MSFDLKIKEKRVPRFFSSEKIQLINNNNNNNTWDLESACWVQQGSVKKVPRHLRP